MGKRELLIIVGFFLVGGIVYQFTAPPVTGDSGFSFSKIFDEAKREMRGNPGRASVTTSGTVPAPASLRELRILRVMRNVQVVGENRSDIAWELTVSSDGPDDATAKVYAEKATFKQDDLGDALVLRMDYPEEGSQQAQATIKVPARLAVRVENATGVKVSGVAGAHLEAVRGSVNLQDITGPVTGLYQDGDVTITGVASVKARLTRLRSKISGVRDGLTLDVRDGECAISGSGGVAEIDSARAEIVIGTHRGNIVVRGADGSVRVDEPTSEAKIDMRRTDIEVSTSGAAPVTIITTDQTARLIVKPSASFILDAVSIEGAVQATDVGLTPETSGRDTKVTHTFGSGKNRVTLRNTRGDIVIRK